MLGERVHMEPLHRLTAVPLPFQGRHLSGFLKREIYCRNSTACEIDLP